MAAVSMSVGMGARQAFGLRKSVYRSAAPWMFTGGEAESRKADAFETKVEGYLSNQGVAFETQGQQQAIFRAAGGRMGPTPDFLITSPLLINGKPVRWIEIKISTGLASFAA